MNKIFILIIMALMVVPVFGQNPPVAPAPAMTPVTEIPPVVPELDSLKVQKSFFEREATLTKFNELKASFERDSLALDKRYQEISAEIAKLVDKAYADAKVSKDKFDFDLARGVFVPKPPAGAVPVSR